MEGVGVVGLETSRAWWKLESISMATEHLVKVGWLSVVYVEWVDGTLFI